MKFYADDGVTLYQGDALAVLREMGDESVNCIVTSPPYFGLRDYGIEGQHGLEETPAEYVETMRSVFAEARRVLAKDGTLWLNLGDSYYSGRGKPGPNSADAKSAARRGWTRAVDRPGADWAKPKNLLGIPWRVAFALQDDGWILRNDIIWAKTQPMPEPVRDRCTSSHEYVFMFSKSRRYYFDAQAIAEQATGESSGNSFRREERVGRGGPDSEQKWEGRPQLARAMKLARDNGLTEEHFAAIRAVGMNDAGKAIVQQDGAGRNTAEVQRLADEAKAVLGGYYREFLTGGTKNRRDVWTLGAEPFPEAHFATFPSALPERCILAGTRSNAIVLDPYSGSGTTGLAAARHGRRYVGIELNPEYLDLSLRTRLGQSQIGA